MDLKKFIKRQIDRRPIEADIVRRIIRAMEENGTPIVKTYDREETVKVSTEEEILEEVLDGSSLSEKEKEGVKASFDAINKDTGFFQKMFGLLL